MKRSTIASPYSRALRFLLVTGMLAFPVLGSSGIAHAQVPPAPPTPSVAVTVQILDGGDGYVNASEATHVKAKGTADPGSQVTVTWDDGSASIVQLVLADAAGKFQTPATNLSTLADGPITVSAQEVAYIDVSAQPLNPETPQVDVPVTLPLGTAATASTIKDTVKPTPTLSVFDDDGGYLNADEIAAGVIVSGQTEPNATVVIKVNAVTKATLTADADGAYSTAPLNLTALADGVLTFSAKATDLAGNTDTTSKTVIKDVVAPATPTVVFDQTLVPANIHAITLSGTGEIGSVVHLEVDDADSRTLKRTADITVDGLGNWLSPAFDLSNLFDGTITATAVAHDAADNASGIATATETKATGATVLPYGVIILDNPASHPGDDQAAVVDGFVDEDAGLDDTANGTSLFVLVSPDAATGSDPLTATVTVSDASGACAGPVSKAMAANSSQATRTVAIPGIAACADGPITANVSLSNADANQTEGSDTTKLDLHKPVSAIGTADGSIFIGIPDIFGNVQIQGSSKDVPSVSAIQFVYVSWTGPTSSGMTATRDFPGSAETSWSLSPDLPPGTYTMTAQAQDESGNFEDKSASNTFTVIVL